MPDPIEIVRNAAGKPEIVGPLGADWSVSLSHDHRYCLAVAGKGAQGCDLEPIGARSKEEWESLLGPVHRELLGELSAHEPLNVAGTRIWSSIECLFKAFGLRNAPLTVMQRDGSAVLFSAMAAKDEVLVLSTPLTFTMGEDRMIALVVSGAQQKSTGNGHASNGHSNGTVAGELPNLDALSQAGFDPGSLSVDGDPETRELILRWPMTFKDAASPDRSAHFASIAEWMGRVREIAMLPVAASVERDIASGQFGMVTNHSTLRLLAPCRPGDSIESRYFVRPTPNRGGAAVDLYFGFGRRRGEHFEPVAFGEMQTTWVRIVGHGAVRPEPFPTEIAAFLQARTPVDFEGLIAARRPSELPPGRAPAWAREPGPIRGPRLLQQSFDTTMVEANLVGNIYFSHYYGWQGRLIDTYFVRFCGDAWRRGESPLVTLSARVDHLADAMPFDSIKVVMYLEALASDRLKLGFDYYRAHPDRPDQKLAHGEQELALSPAVQGTALTEHLLDKAREELK